MPTQENDDLRYTRWNGHTDATEMVVAHPPLVLMTDNNVERGIAAGTYYFALNNPGSGTATGVFRAHWEERA